LHQYPGKLRYDRTIGLCVKGIRWSRYEIGESLSPSLLHYKGSGIGILRALRAYPHIDFIDDTEAEQVRVVIHRTANLEG